MLAGLAFVGLLGALYFQRRSFEAQVEYSEISRIDVEESRLEILYFNMMSMYADVVGQLEVETPGRGVLVGRLAIKYVCKKFEDFVLSANVETLDDFDKAYSRFIEKCLCGIGHCFRVVYHVVNFIHYYKEGIGVRLDRVNYIKKIFCTYLYWGVFVNIL